MISNCKNIKLYVNYDKYGALIPIEELSTVPFDIKRIYYIYDVHKGVRRGFHSHKELEQLLICVKGSCRILLKTPNDFQEVLLNAPDMGLYIGPMV